MTAEELRMLVVGMGLIAFAILACGDLFACAFQNGIRSGRVRLGAVVVALFFFLAATDCGADKGALRLTRWLMTRSSSEGLGGLSDNLSADILSGVDFGGVEAACADFAVCGLTVSNGVLTADVCRPSDEVDSAESFDVLYAYSLSGDWYLLDESCGFAAGETNCHVTLSAGILPGALTNAPASFFAEFGRHIDSDGDQLYDTRERRIYGTLPNVWDSDGDGLGDGFEVASGIDPLLRDTDGDGYDDDEELIAGGDPLLPDSGAEGSVRYYYDDDDRLTAAHVGGGAVTADLTAAGNARSLRLR